MDNSHKSKYYSKYVDFNLAKLLKKLDTKNTVQVNNLFWLLKMYFETYNDNPKIIETFETFLLNQPNLNLNVYDIEVIMNVYGRLGQINMQIY